MHKKVLNKPVLILLYGYPGSGKTFLGRQLSTDISAALINGEQLRAEFFDDPTYTKEENEIVEHLSLYMCEQFLTAGTSVIYDTNSYRTSQRRVLREMAARAKAEILTIWLQLDIESAFTRVAIETADELMTNTANQLIELRLNQSSAKCKTLVVTRTTLWLAVSTPIFLRKMLHTKNF